MTKEKTKKMHPVNRFLQKIILAIIDFVYIPFKKYIPYQLFRYGCSGGANMVFDWVLYFIFYNFIFCHNVLHIGPIAISAHIASFVFTFPITFFSGLLEPAEQYTVGGILKLTEGSLNVASCTAQGAAACSRSTCCNTLPMWERLDKMVDGFFEGITLQDLIEEEQK